RHLLRPDRRDARRRDAPRGRAPLAGLVRLGRPAARRRARAHRRGDRQGPARRTDARGAAAVIALQAPDVHRTVPGRTHFLRELLFLPPAASAQARDIDSLHFSVIAITMLGAFAVGTTALVFLVKYRRGPGGPKPTPRISASVLKFEVPLWS